MVELLTNCEGCGRNRSWPILRYYPGIRFEDPRKTMKSLIHYSAVPVTVSPVGLRVTRSGANEKYLSVHKANLC
jgi:hypothetical protein